VQITFFVDALKLQPHHEQVEAGVTGGRCSCYTTGPTKSSYWKGCSCTVQFQLTEGLHLEKQLPCEVHVVPSRPCNACLSSNALAAPSTLVQEYSADADLLGMQFEVSEVCLCSRQVRTAWSRCMTSGEVIQ
jgi:hypothetical protein